MATNYAFATLLTSDAYLPGALALVAALNDLHSSPHLEPVLPFQTVCLVTPETVDISSIKLLRKAFNVVVGVEVIQQQDTKGLQLLGRPDLYTVLTKLHIFRLTQYSKIIFLDADVLPVRPLSHLFTLPHEFSAVPDVGWPDIFNSGVLVFSPGEEKFNQLTTLLKSKGSWDGGDQGILNEWRGDNWHRLSFIYNTTPTAVYTYAPAYERFGSQISAIHFIGPKKPWNALSYRPPFIKSSDSVSPDQAYDYNSLLDRWFAVYDKHYRSQPITVGKTFQVQKYTSAWESQPTSAAIHTPSPPSGPVLSLEELRRAAIEGLHSMASLTRNRQNEGDYVTLPLEGRVDLMRPKTAQEPVPVEDADAGKNPPKLSVSQYGAVLGSTSSGGDSRAGYADLQPPSVQGTGTGGVTSPGSASQGASLGDIGLGYTSLGDTGMGGASFGITGFGDSSPRGSIAGLGSTSLMAAAPEGMYPRITSIASTSAASGALFELHAQADVPSTPLRKPVESGLPVIWGPLLTPDPRDIPPSPRPKPLSLPPTPTTHPWVSKPPSTPPRVPPSIPEQESARRGSPEEEPRPRSPPLLLWNPAIEPPPTTAPVSSFPADTFYPNAWDQTSASQSNSLFHHQDHAQLFQPPPTPQIPKPLVRQGHYREVTGEAISGATPTPDPNKVKHVFPWEDQLRSAPSRFFSDLQPPAQPMSMPTKPAATTLSPGHLTPLSPLRGLPVNLAYANTWDTIPGIQKYATRFRPPKLPAPFLAPAFDDKEWKTLRSQGEISSRDADDEESEGESSAAESDKGKAPSGRTSRRSSIVSASELITGKRKQYKTRGVQTVPRDVRSRGVQVNTFLVEPENSFKAKNRPFSPGPSEASLLPDLPMSTAMPSPTAEPYRPLQSPPRVGGEQQSAGPRTTAPLQVPPQPPIRVSTFKSPSLVSRQFSNESSLGSPASSGPPLSPADLVAGQSPVRKAGRVWDPARGVEVFKQGTEEILARFKKMGSWEDGPTRPIR